MVNHNSQTIPAWLVRHLSRDDIQTVMRAIRSVELNTDGEIVPVIVRRSVMTNHIGTICTLTLWLFTFATAVMFELHHQWLELGLGLLATGIVGLALGQNDAMIRLLTPTSELERCVWRRAQAEFFNEGIGRTQRTTGILLFISILEHRAVVLADHAIASKYPAEIWQDVVNLLLAGVKRNQLGQGLCHAIERCGAIIQPHFPKVDGAGNELPDRLVILE